MNIIIIILLVLIAIAVLLLFLRNPAKASQEIRRQELEELAKRHDEAQQRLADRMREEANTALARQEAASRSELAAIRDAYERQVETLRNQLAEQTRILTEKSSLQFENLSNAALEAQRAKMREASQRELDSILTPLREKISEFSKAFSDAHLSDTASRQSLSEQIDRLIRLNNTIGEETRSLTSALKGDSKVQGDWGEMILETLLESAGMTKDVNFFVQPARNEAGVAIADEEGNRLRPDILVKLPDEHALVIDSKVSLTAYIKMCKAECPEDKETAVKDHLRSVRRHVDELGSKQYQKHWSNTVDHTLMFIPNEGAYFAAVRHDPQLWKYAYDKKVVIVSPTHVFSVMQIISQLWRQESQNRNAAEIARLGGLLYDRMAKYNELMLKIQTKLNETGRAYEDAYNVFAGSNQSITRTAERLRDLGARTSRKLPSS